jgi:hypothetical protein
MELILAIGIIATMSAVAVPSYARYIESTREKVCIINRQSILYDYQLYCISEPDITLAEYMNTFYEGQENTLCPSGGSYTAEGSGDTATLTCSVHGDEVGAADEESVPSGVN